MGTKEKYPREQGSMKLSSGNARTTLNFYKFSLTRDVHGGRHRRKTVAMLSREQIKESCGNMETEGNFGREQGLPGSGERQCSAPTLLKGNSYISTHFITHWPWNCAAIAAFVFAQWNHCIWRDHKARLSAVFASTTFFSLSYLEIV